MLRQNASLFYKSITVASLKETMQANKLTISRKFKFI